MGRSASQSRQIARLKAMADRDIDTSDIPERSDWSRAEVGKFYRPVKQQITLRIDADIIAWFKARGGKYQTAVNAALREYARRNAVAAGTTFQTGDVCPESGVWKVAGRRQTMAFAMGDRFPPYGGRAVDWEFVSAA